MQLISQATLKTLFTLTSVFPSWGYKQVPYLVFLNRIIRRLQSLSQKYAQQTHPVVFSDGDSKKWSLHSRTCLAEDWTHRNHDHKENLNPPQHYMTLLHEIWKKYLPRSFVTTERQVLWSTAGILEQRKKSSRSCTFLAATDVNVPAFFQKLLSLYGGKLYQQ